MTYAKRWVQTLRIGDVWKNEAMSFAERRDVIVARIRRLRPDECGEVEEIADALAAAKDAAEWDRQWAGFYDWADLNDVWVQTTREG